MPRFDRPVKLQASIFMPGAQWGSTARAARELTEILQPEIPAHPLPISVPADAGSEVPRLIFTAVDQTWHVILSPLRVDIQALAGPGPAVEADVAERFWGIAHGKFTRIIEQFRLDVTRLAFVVEVLGTLSEDEGSPAEYIQSHFFSNRIPATLFDGLTTAEFHALCRASWVGPRAPVPTNRWTRLKASQVVGTNEPVLLLELDFNTIPAPTTASVFNHEEIQAFFAEPTAYVPRIFDLVSSVER